MLAFFYIYTESNLATANRIKAAGCYKELVAGLPVGNHVTGVTVVLVAA